MKVIFIISGVNEARIIRGLAMERNIESKVYENLAEAVGNETKADVVVADYKVTNEELLGTIFSLSSNFLFILPFWINAAEEIHKLRKTAEKLGFRKKKIRVIKRPFTAQELINYIEKIFGISNLT